MNKRIVTVDLAGTQYKMSSDASEAHLKELANMVNERVHELGNKAKRSATPAQLLAIVALGLAEDLLNESTKRQTFEDKTKTTIRSVIEQIDQKIEAISTRD